MCIVFINYTRYFIPDRDSQIRTLCSLIPDPGEPFQVLELACGAGDLAGALLERYPNCTVRGLDGSHEMLRTTRQHLAAFGSRFEPGKFDLFARDWRTGTAQYRAAVSSLAIHHLDDSGKAGLFRDVYAMLQPGGAFLVANIIRPASELGMAHAADAYDEAVRRQSLEADGSLELFHRYEKEEWNNFRYPDDPMDKPSTLLDQLKWLEQAGFQKVDVFWLRAGHAIFGGTK